MKPFSKILSILLFLQFIILAGCPATSNQPDCSNPDNAELEACINGGIDDPGNGNEPIDCSTPVGCYGKLKANGNRIVGSKTGITPVQLKGVSLGHSRSDWESGKFFGSYAAANIVNSMVDSWKAEIIRVPQAVNPDNAATGAASNKEGVIRVIDLALEKGVYVIIDWHSHAAHLQTEQAKAFFREMACTYGHLDNVIFEIYNEPVPAQSGSWENIKPYAEQVISVIRGECKSENLILVGTPRWCQDVNAPVGNFLSDNNVAYVIHFYAATHNIAQFSDRINNVLNAGKPVFASEFGTVTSDGGQNANLNSHDPASTTAWLNFFNERDISYCAWQVNNKNEGSAFFVSTTNVASSSTDWANTNNMTASGKYIFSMLNDWANSSPWRKR